MQAIEGPAIPGFPQLTAMIHGMVGVVVIAGETKIGKSTFATQLAVAVAGPDFPVVVCDLENRVGGQSGLNKRRANQMYGSDWPGLRYVQEAHSFEEGRAMLRAEEGNGQTGRGLLVVDSLQASLGLSPDDTSARTAAATSRMQEIEDSVGEGYSVLLTSQISRSHYGREPSLQSLIWASAIEQKAWSVLAYWQAPGSKGDRLLRAKALRQDPNDLDLRQAKLILAGDKNHRMSECELASRGNNVVALGAQAPKAKRRDGDAAKVLKRRGPLPFSQLVRLVPGSRSWAAEKIARERTSGTIAYDEAAGLYDYAK